MSRSGSSAESISKGRRCPAPGGLPAWLFPHLTRLPLLPPCREVAPKEAAEMFLEGCLDVLFLHYKDDSLFNNSLQPNTVGSACGAEWGGSGVGVVALHSDLSVAQC